MLELGRRLTCSCTPLHKFMTDRERERESNFEIIFAFVKHITEKSEPNDVTEVQSRLYQLTLTKQAFSYRQEESQSETPIKFASPQTVRAESETLTSMHG